MGETHRSVETFIGVVVAQTDLQLDSLDELAGLAGGQQVADGLLQEVRVNFAH